jgi:GAF domain-containing protein
VSDEKAATALGLLPDDNLHRSLLSSIVDVARAFFGARAASVFLLDEQADELVFEAVSGEGEDSLIGRRFPSSTGIAGWVLTTLQPLVLDDVSRDRRFATEAAASTGYTPRSIMAVPLLSGERSLGVLEVLDRPFGERFTLEQSDLLAMFAAQAAIALDLLLRSRAARAALDDDSSDAAALARIAQALLDRGDEEDRRAGAEFLQALERMVTRPR